MNTGRSADHRGLAMLLILGAVACASTQDALLKWVSGGYPLHELARIIHVDCECGMADMA